MEPNVAMSQREAKAFMVVLRGIGTWGRAAAQRARAWAVAAARPALSGLYDLGRQAVFGAHRDPKFEDKGLLLLVQTGSMQS